MSIANSIRAQIPPVHPEGYPFIGGFALASLILFWIWTPLGWIGTLLTIWCALFFRDPVRVTPVREGIVVAPADGRISMVTQVLPPAELGLGDRPLPRDLDIHERVQLPCEPQSGRRADRPHRLSAGHLHQRRARQGERRQRAQFAGHLDAERAHRRGPDRRPGGAADRLVRPRGAVDRRRRAVRPDPVRLAARRLSARRHQGAGLRRPDRGRRRDRFWPISGLRRRTRTFRAD